MNNDKGSVLVVDDEESVRQTVCALLQKHGFLVKTAHSGPEALRLASEQEFEAVLLDLRMPVMDGMEVFRELRKRECSAEVIFLTAYGTITSAVDALKLGAMDYLIKPGAIHDLAEKTAKAVQLHRKKKCGVVQQAMFELANRYKLTPKQAEVCQNIIAGKSNAEIARAMNISEYTVKTHLKKVFERLEVESRTALAAKVFHNLDEVQDMSS